MIPKSTAYKLVIMKSLPGTKVNAGKSEWEIIGEGNKADMRRRAKSIRRDGYNAQVMVSHRLKVGDVIQM